MKKHITLLSAISISAASMAQTVGDINHIDFYSYNHDSTICATFINTNSIVDIDNSFVGDSIKFIGFSGQVLFEDENTSGAGIWNVTYPYPQNWVEADELISGGILNTVVPSDIYKIISGPDTLNVNPTFFSEPIPDACGYNTVSGQIYIDAKTAFSSVTA